MNPREFEMMASVEAEHWWYRGLRQILGQAIQRFGRSLPDQPRVLDAGCGTGENLRFLHGLLAPRYVGGFDPSPQAIAWAKKKVPEADVYASDVCQPELHCDSYDIVLSCDVLYIPGLAAAHAGMSSIVERMAPGGLLLVNVPAYNWLRSNHDLAIGTRQRFVGRDIRRFLVDIGLTPRLVTYRLCLLFPLVVASRLPSILCPSKEATSVASALKPANRWTNQVLGQAMSVENRLLHAGLRMPWGSSVFAVGQKS